MKKDKLTFNEKISVIKDGITGKENFYFKEIVNINTIKIIIEQPLICINDIGVYNVKITIYDLNDGVIISNGYTNIYDIATVLYNYINSTDNSIDIHIYQDFVLNLDKIIIDDLPVGIRLNIEKFNINMEIEYSDIYEINDLLMNIVSRYQDIVTSFFKAIIIHNKLIITWNKIINLFKL